MEENFADITRRLEKQDGVIEALRAAIGALAAQSANTPALLKEFDDASRGLRQRLAQENRPEWYTAHVTEHLSLVRAFLAAGEVRKS